MPSNKANAEAAKGQAIALSKKKLKEAIKKSKAGKEVNKTVKEYPTLSALGAVGLNLAKKAAIKAEKRFKFDKSSSLTVGAEYNPRTKEKKISANWNKSF